MALPPPDEGFVESILREYDDGVAAIRREPLDPGERQLDDWLISIEAAATFEADIPGQLPGFVTFAFDVEGEPGLGARPVARAFVRPGAYLEEPEPLPVLAVRGAEQPLEIEVRVEPWEPRLHADLADGTMTCLVHLEDDRHAVLTARHVVVDTTWQSAFAVMEGNRQPVRVLWHSPNCLDATVLDSADLVGAECLSLAGPKHLAHVEVLTKAGPVQRTVRSFNHTFGSFTSRAPHLIWLDEPLQPGDSGSLVRDVDGRAIGMYLGLHDTVERGPLGLCQGLMQLNELFRAKRSTKGLCLPVDVGH